MQSIEQIEAPPNNPGPFKQARGWLVTVIIIGFALILCSALWFRLSKRIATDPAKKESADTSSVEIDSAMRGLRIVTVSRKVPASTLSTPGKVEANQQQLQQVTPLVGGRVDNIYVAAGDHVVKGALLVSIDSPQVAEMHGKLHEAETRLQLACINLNRAQQSANRVSVLKAKASLNESEATLKRIRKLVCEGLSARKDLVTAESDYERAKAEFNFQKDISLNKEITEAKAAVKTAQTDAAHIRDGLKALDARMGPGNGVEHDISKIELRSPIAGIVIERFVNPGAGVEQGKPLLTVANTSTLWVIANVPESQMASIRVGNPAIVKLGKETIAGKVSYIDPRLKEDTRTSQVRIEIPNPDRLIQIGNFAQIEFRSSNSSQHIVVPASAVQTVKGKPVVFVKVGSKKFAVRAVSVGTTSSDMVPVLSGLKSGEQIATDGSFILKSKLLKEQFGDND